jgi:hypothetical protein
MPKPFLLEARDIPQAWKILVPEYRSARYSPVVVDIKRWEPKYAKAIRKISEKRSCSRIENYIIPEEIKRVKERVNSKDTSIRFGRKKEGHGYHGDRGDFCLLGGAIHGGGYHSGRDLTLFYRSLELIGGFAYDLVLIHHLSEVLELRWRSIRILANSAHAFALKKNSNEKLFPKLVEIFSK